MLTGSAGDMRSGKLSGKPESRNIAWAPAHHFILVEYKGGKMHVTPYGELKNGKLEPLTNVKDPKKKPFPLPMVVSLT